MTVKEEIHALVDELPEDEAERLLEILRIEDPLIRARELALWNGQPGIRGRAE